jgi:hypothetical protein
VGKYHTLNLLDDPNAAAAAAKDPTAVPVPKLFNFPTTLYKGFSSLDGLPYTIRRVDIR